jgi:hypothetical protein
MPLFGAKGGLDSGSPETFNPLTGHVLLEYENSRGPVFHKIFHSLARGNRYQTNVKDKHRKCGMNYVTELSNILRDSNVNQDDRQEVLNSLRDLADNGTY